MNRKEYIMKFLEKRYLKDEGKICVYCGRKLHNEPCMIDEDTYFGDIVYKDAEEAEFFSKYIEKLKRIKEGNQIEKI